MKSSSVSEWVNKICPKCISLVMVQNPRRVNYCEKCGSKLEMTPQSGKIKSPPFNLERFKETAQKAKETFVGKEWDEQLMDFLYPGTERRFAFDEDQVAVNPLKLKQLVGSISAQVEQRGYERAKRELSVKYGGQG